MYGWPFMMSQSDRVRTLTPPLVSLIIFSNVKEITEKFLQAVRALNRIKTIDPENPELHVRLVHLRHTISSLPQPPPEPIGSVLSGSLDELLSPDVSLETYNSQYLQQHSTSGRGILAAAKVLRLLGATPAEEIDNTIFTVFNPDVQLDVNVSIPTLTLLLPYTQIVSLTLFPLGRPRHRRLPQIHPIITGRRVPLSSRQEIRTLHHLQNTHRTHLPTTRRYRHRRRCRKGRWRKTRDHQLIDLKWGRSMEKVEEFI